MYVVKAFSRMGNQAFCSTQTRSLISLWVYVLLSWPSVHISQSRRNERAYLSSIRIYMLGNVFFTHTHTQRWETGRQLGLSLILQYSCAVIGLFPFPQGLSSWWHILGTGTINIFVFIMHFIMSILGSCRVTITPSPPILAISPSYALFSYRSSRHRWQSGSSSLILFVLELVCKNWMLDMFFKPL